MGLFHSSYKDPAKAAKPYLDRAEQTTRAAYDPYIQRGNEAGQILSNEYDTMLNDPAKIIDYLMSSYEPSAGYQYKQNQLTKSIGNTARAGGVAGTSEHQRQQAEMIDSLLGADMQEWLGNLLGVRNQGLQGYQGWDTQGYNATQNEAGDLGNIYGTQSQLAYKGAEQHNANHNDMLQGLMKLFGTIGGSIAGGPIGGAIGNKIGGAFGQPKYDR